MNKLLVNGVVLSVILITLFFISGCSNSDSSPVTNNPSFDANSINGTITFVDNAFISDTNVGYYSVSAFANWPPTANATATAKIVPVLSGGKYTATFKIIVPSDGSYTITSSFIKLPYIPGSVYGLGMYDVPGNDTTHNFGIIMGSHPKATISSGAGVGNINFNSWIDTAKKIYKF